MAYQIKYTSTPITAGSSSSGNAPGGNAPTTSASASVSAASSSITHTVALDGGVNQAHFENNSSTFTKMRITIHTTDQGRAVQVDMRTDEGDRRGQLVWKLVNYQHSSSEIRFFDYDLGAPVAVKTLYKAIRFEWSLHQYLFSAGGSGCHYWNYNLLRLMASDPDRFHLHSDVPTHAYGVFGMWYSRTGFERPNQPILQGQFQTYAEWWQDWFGDDDGDDDDDDYE